jgi:hypothetical protein
MPDNLTTSQEQPAAPLTGAELVRITQVGSSRHTTAAGVAKLNRFVSIKDPPIQRERKRCHR